MNEMTRSQKLSAAGLKPRDTRIACETCGAKCTPQLLPVHKCPADFADTAPNLDVGPHWMEPSSYNMMTPNELAERIKAGERWALDVRKSAPLSWPDLTPAMREAEIWQERGITTAPDDAERAAGPCSDFFGPTDGPREVRPLRGCGIIAAVLLVVFSWAVAYVITESVSALRHGEVAK